MLATLLPWLADGLVLLGMLILTLALWGVLRMPDLYSSLHAASKAAALGLAPILIAAGIEKERSFCAVCWCSGSCCSPRRSPPMRSRWGPSVSSRGPSSSPSLNQGRAPQLAAPAGTDNVRCWKGDVRRSTTYPLRDAGNSERHSHFRSRWTATFYKRADAELVDHLDWGVPLGEQQREKRVSDSRQTTRGSD